MKQLKTWYKSVDKSFFKYFVCPKCGSMEWGGKKKYYQQPKKCVNCGYAGKNWQLFISPKEAQLIKANVV